MIAHELGLHTGSGAASPKGHRANMCCKATANSLGATSLHMHGRGSCQVRAAAPRNELLRDGGVGDAQVPGQRRQTARLPHRPCTTGEP